MFSSRKYIEIALFTVMACITSLTMGADRLERIEQSLIEESGITHIPLQFLASSLARQVDDIVIFDVREEDEYAVSHLQNAIRVDPALAGEEFVSQFGDAIRDKQVIFYCSTGRRSTALAERVRAVINSQAIDLTVPANLQGGIFRWHNNAQALVNAGGTTDYVHPYSWWWKRLLTRKELTRYEP